MTKQERAEARKVKLAEKKRLWREALMKVNRDDVFLFWLAHNRGIKSVPKAAQENTNGRGAYYFDGPKLFCGNDNLIAEQITSKGKPSYIMLVRTPSDIDVLQQMGSSIKGNGPLVHVQNGALTFNSTARAAYQFSKYPFRNTNTPGELSARQKEQDKYARSRARYYRPVAVKHRAEYERLRVIAYEAGMKVSNAMYLLRPTNDEVLALLGHTHVDGMMYKRLHKTRGVIPLSNPVAYRMQRSDAPPVPATASTPDQFRSNAGAFIWPAIGEWTVPVENVFICNRGYHLCPKDAIDNWASHGDHLFLAEGDTPGGEQPDKTVYTRARLVKYIGNIGTITKDMIATHRKMDFPKLKAEAEAAEKTRLAYYETNKKYL